MITSLPTTFHSDNTGIAKACYRALSGSGKACTGTIMTYKILAEVH